MGINKDCRDYPSDHDRPAHRLFPPLSNAIWLLRFDGDDIGSLSGTLETWDRHSAPAFFAISCVWGDLSLQQIIFIHNFDIIVNVLKLNDDTETMQLLRAGMHARTGTAQHSCYNPTTEVHERRQCPQGLCGRPAGQPSIDSSTAIRRAGF